MNFKIFIILISLYGCGVKSVPIAPLDVAIPSYIDSYLDDNEIKK